MEMSFKQYCIVSPGQDLHCQEVDLATTIANLPPKGILVKVHSAGVCHSDLHQLHGGYNLSETETILFAEREGYGYPKVPGHEIAGTIYTFGKCLESDKECLLRRGDRVCVFPWIGCTECTQCDNGLDTYCTGGVTYELGLNINGGYSEFVTVPHYRYCLPIPDSISTDIAAILGCSCLTAYNAVKTVLSVIPQPLLLWKPSTLQVAVIGLGGLGQWAVSFIPILLASFNINITGIDVQQSRLDDLLQAGKIQQTFLLSSSQSAKEQANKCRQGTLSGYQVVIDFVNNPQTFDLSFNLLGSRGIQIAVGLFGGTGSIQLPLLALSRKTIVGVQTGSLVDFKEVVVFLSANIDTVGSPNLIPYALSDCTKALKDLENGRVAGRAILKIVE